MVFKRNAYNAKIKKQRKGNTAQNYVSVTIKICRRKEVAQISNFCLKYVYQG